MVSLTLSIPEDLKSKMDEHSETNWSEIARKAIIERLEMMDKFKKFVNESKMTEADAIKLGREVNKKLAKRYVK